MTHAINAAADDCAMWTVYKRPRDYHDHFVARKFSMITGRATDEVLVRDSLHSVRHAVAERMDNGGVCIERSPDDAPVIVETWL